MKHCSFDYVRIHRQRHGLSKKDLAKLLGRRFARSVGKLERGEREPTLDTAIALQVIFDAAPRELFPGLYQAIEKVVMRRRRVLLEALKDRTDSRSASKRELLEDMLARSLANIIEA